MTWLLRHSLVTRQPYKAAACPRPFLSSRQFLPFEQQCSVFSSAKRETMKRKFSTTASALVLSMLIAANGDTSALAGGKKAAAPTSQDALATATPIKHVVVIFGENESFDHYFGTYPSALTISGEPSFVPAPNTPTVINTVKPPFTSSPCTA